MLTVSEYPQLVIRCIDQPGDLGWVVMAHGELYSAEFGWDSSFEALIARIVADFADTRDPSRGAAWIAELDGKRVGCIFCVAENNTTAKLRILMVLPSGRGFGVGGALVDTCVAFARDAGYQTLQLWTNSSLVSARRLYLSRGFELKREEQHHSFGMDLIGQTYELPLQRLPMSPNAA
ncbi:GNAT family N-acetyltransferase [Lysinibacter cavernae]|uniref:GNAT family N-acetyltransferase n=1 Tax=Lysinibacter cavernae TaxID=1640652 RepID=UPI00361847A3